MNVLQILKDSLIGTNVVIYRSVHNPNHILLHQDEGFEKETAVVTNVLYVEPYGEFEMEGGDYFEMCFSTGTAIINHF